MSAPTSATSLPDALRNSSAPMVDERGVITKTWRYIFGLFAQKSTTVSPTYSVTIDASYNQTQLQGLADQVAKISAIVGRT